MGVPSGIIYQLRPLALHGDSAKKYQETYPYIVHGASQGSYKTKSMLVLVGIVFLQVGQKINWPPAFCVELHVLYKHKLTLIMV